MTDVYEFSEFNRHDLIYSFNNMSEEEIKAARERLEKYNADQAAKKASAAAAAKEPPTSSVPAAPVSPPPVKPEPPAVGPNVG
jgi:formate hydrogenlyase subunit 6/NADH:ubiquinone oxidoreductase subunit I